MRGERLSRYLRGDDPAPGDVGEIQTIVDALNDAAEAVGAALSTLEAIGRDNATWTGAAATMFIAKQEEIRKRLSAAKVAYHSGAECVSTWMRRLITSQADAAANVARANAIGAGLDSTSVLNGVFGAVPPELREVQHCRDEIAAKAHRDAQDCANSLTEAIQAVQKFEHSLWDRFTDDLKKAKELINDVLPYIAALSLVLAVIPIAGEVVLLLELAAALDAVSIGASAASAAIDVTLVLSGKETGSEFAIGIAEAGLGMAGVFGGVAAKGARTAGRMEAGAAEASRQSGAFSAAAERRVAAWLDGADVNLADVVRLNQYSDDAAAATSRLAAGADDAARSTSVGGSIRPGLHDIRHPTEALHTNDLLKQADSYRDLHGLDRWLPPGHQAPAAIGEVLHTADGAHAVHKISEDIRHWVEGRMEERSRR